MLSGRSDAPMMTVMRPELAACQSSGRSGPDACPLALTGDCAIKRTEILPNLALEGEIASSHNQRALHVYPASDRTL